MNKVSVLYYLMHASFLERTRRYSFLITLGITIYVGYTFVPPNDANYVTVAFGAFRGVYNSAWIGSMVAIMTVIFLALPGFYIVNNSLALDRQTGVGYIIATSPLSRRLYILGKALSNFAILSTMVGVLFVVAIVMQFIRGEEGPINLWALLVPFLFIALPAMTLVAALATFFETVSWLRGGIGNVLYFFVWLGLVMPAIAPLTKGAPRILVPFVDSLGASIPLLSMSAACRAAFPAYNENVSVGYASKSAASALQTFHWAGIVWTPEIILGRLFWIGIAFGIVSLAALIFDRFDPARETRRGRFSHVMPIADAEVSLATSVSVVPRAHLSRLPSPQLHFHFSQLLRAELHLMLKGVGRWWYVVAAALIVTSLFTPLSVARALILPAVWIWPLMRWSAMGTREAQNRTGKLIFSSPHPLRRQLPATWMSGAILAFFAGSGVLVRLLLARNWAAVLAWVVCALFIPSLALASGVWTGSSKFFEVIFTLIWYVGPLSRVSVLDFMGISDKAIKMGVPFIYLGCTIVLMGLIAIGRRQRIYYS